MPTTNGQARSKRRWMLQAQQCRRNGMPSRPRLQHQLLWRRKSSTTLHKSETGSTSRTLQTRNGGTGKRWQKKSKGTSKKWKPMPRSMRWTSQVLKPNGTLRSPICLPLTISKTKSERHGKKQQAAVNCTSCRVEVFWTRLPLLLRLVAAER